ncbi:CRISPR-associated protein, TIGR02710 family [Thermodesulfatator indicus DSM 15286]|uniref:CRISPR-associated protein, TIGR02710 family n=1 Tax=Thermodesulfatator indicus (strain DSM 15286 / JCM 11887 / CIR29812) TaxID=667014 RepID=F8A970_THEID|nr:TIGR02710 family CRISPR-associated CARF protein [Thermodesulfatator indicus]AEH45206.1 CRISPR-associated protein, TIGR02710 family [Thermodesulfatator indicus DSM 15286]
MALKKGLLISIGTGVGDTPESILNAISLSISERNPNFIAFIVSDKSKKNAQIVCENLGIDKKHYNFFEISNPNDLDKCVKKTNEAVDWLLKQNLSSHQIIADFTSGTKPMSSAIVLVAFQRNIGSLSYVQGERIKGIVKKGTEQVMSFKPIISKIYSNINEAYKSLKIYQFDTASSIITECQEFRDLLSENRKNELDYLENIIKAYHSWDLFKHHEAEKYFSKAETAFKKLEKNEFISLFPEKKTLKSLKILGNFIYQNKKDKIIIADLLANAKRRIKEGKYDDAMARLYRIFELVGQTILFSKYGLNSSDLDLDKIRNLLGSKFEKWTSLLQRDPTDNKVKIGARKVYELLNDLGHNVRKELESFKTLLAQRNNSILAHGLKPIEKETVEKLWEKIFDLCQKHFDNFEKTYQQLIFSWDQ